MRSTRGRKGANQWSGKATSSRVSASSRLTLSETQGGGSMNWLFNLNYLKSKRTTHGTGESARFAVGERVSIRKGSSRENDSTPYYVRGKSGIVEEICAPFTNPYRTASKPAGRAPPRTYRTRFSAREVWPELPGASGETFIIRLSEDWLMPLH